MTQRRYDISIPTLSDLATVWVAPLKEGCLAWVEGSTDYFSLRKSSGAVPDGINIITPLTGAPIAGFTAARWIRLSTSAGGIGLAFANIAEMAAYPTAPLTKGATAEVLSLETIWNYDPTSTLAPDVSAGSPLGRTIVAANGPGNWLRDRQFASLRWREQSTWFLDPANVLASDENNGNTALTPLFSDNELQDRIGGYANGNTFYDVTVRSAVMTPVVTDIRTKSGAFYLYYHGTLTAIAFGGAASAAIDAKDDWAPAVPTPGTITVNALPVSWTASGMIGKLAIVTASVAGNLGNRFWIIEQDSINPKKAFISDVDLGGFSGLTGTVAVGDVIQVYNAVQFGTTVSAELGGGENAQVNWQYLTLGDDTAHSVEIKLGVGWADACHVHGVDSSGGAIFQGTQNNYGKGVRAEQGSSVVSFQGYCHEGGVDARSGARASLCNLVCVDTIAAESGGVVSTFNNGAPGWICSRAPSATAFIVRPMALLDAFTDPGYLFGAGVTTNAFIIQAGGRVVFDHAKPPQYAGTPNPVSLGAMAPITFAELPYTNPIDGAAMVEGNAPNATEDNFGAQTLDVSPLGAIVPVFTLSFTVNGLRQCLFHTAYACQQAADTSGTIQLWIDGVSVQSWAVGGVAGLAGLYETGGHLWKASLAAGVHTASVAAGTAAGQLFFRAATVPAAEGSSVLVRELYG